MDSDAAIFDAAGELGDDHLTTVLKMSTRLQLNIVSQHKDWTVNDGPGRACEAWTAATGADSAGQYRTKGVRAEMERAAAG